MKHAALACLFEGMSGIEEERIPLYLAHDFMESNGYAPFHCVLDSFCRCGHLCITKVVEASVIDSGEHQLFSRIWYTLAGIESDLLDPSQKREITPSLAHGFGLGLFRGLGKLYSSSSDGPLKDPGRLVADLILNSGIQTLTVGKGHVPHGWDDMAGQAIKALAQHTWFESGLKALTRALSLIDEECQWPMGGRLDGMSEVILDQIQFTVFGRMTQKERGKRVIVEV